MQIGSTYIFFFCRQHFSWVFVVVIVLVVIVLVWGTKLLIYNNDYYYLFSLIPQTKSLKRRKALTTLTWGQGLALLQ